MRHNLRNVSADSATVSWLSSSAAIVFFKQNRFTGFTSYIHLHHMCEKKSRLFKRVQNLFCFSCVKMISALLIFPWLCCTLKPLQHVVHTPLHHFVGGHWPVESTGQCGFSWMRSLCSGAEWEGTCYFSEDEISKSKNNSTRTNTEITVSPYLFYKYELDTLVAASDNGA